MFEEFNDAELLNLRPERLVEYLSRAKWTEQETLGSHARLYLTPSGIEVRVPTHQDLRDYPRAVREVLEFVAEESGLDPKVVLHDIQFVRRDITRFAAVTEGDDAMIGIDALPRLIKGARDTVRGAASLALNNSSEERKYLKDAKFGPTEQGSYVVTVLSPPLQLEEQFTMFDNLPPARRVTYSIQKAISETRNAVTRLREGDDKAFDNAAELGITSQTCRGLYSVVSPFDSVRCRITAASLSLSPSPAPLDATFALSDASFLKEAAKELRDKELADRPDTRLIGYIKTFDRGEQDEDGKATMKTLMGDPEKIHTVHMMLNPEQYDLANDSHLRRAYVEARGMLKQATANTWWLQDATIQRVLE